VEREPVHLIGLGATKSGTSWLWQHLFDHPECHLRTIKEYNYFFLRGDTDYEVATRETRAAIAAQQARIAALPEAERAFAATRLADLEGWLALLETGRVTDADYRAFLRDGAPAGTRLTADITPAYALLGRNKLGQMTRCAGDVRFVYLMREPVARLWSHVRMAAPNVQTPGESLATAAERLLADVIAGAEHAEARWIAERGAYAAHLARFREHLAGATLLVMFTEDLLTPGGAARLDRFLGLTPDPAPALGQKIHAGLPLDLPEGLAARARDWLRPQYDAARRFGALPPAWQETQERAFA
jgi:hypothetical protein